MPVALILLPERAVPSSVQILSFKRQNGLLKMSFGFGPACTPIRTGSATARLGRIAPQPSMALSPNINFKSISKLPGWQSFLPQSGGVSSGPHTALILFSRFCQRRQAILVRKGFICLPVAPSSLFSHELSHILPLRRFKSLCGGSPNSRLYSRLNWVMLS